MPQFAATIKHLSEGVKGFTISAAVKNIEGWETTLEKVDAPGVKPIISDLGSLKKHLQAESLDGGAIFKLMAKLGKETVAVAKKGEGEKAESIQALGNALLHFSEKDGAEAKS